MPPLSPPFANSCDDDEDDDEDGDEDDVSLSLVVRIVEYLSTSKGLSSTMGIQSSYE